ncbi:MAG: ORF6N domain-containing protein [Burkholderiales bacterium]|nr:ORF6N domain-containing protein [Opitutaceae bacterium]
MAKASSRSGPGATPELPRIHTVRKQKVMLDSELAALFGVETKVFNQAIRRNSDRFPKDFAFQLIDEEFAHLKSRSATSSPAPSSLRSQFVTLEKSLKGKHVKYLPWVFTEHGAIMAAMVLRSEHAVAMSVFVVRAFVQMREQIGANLGVLRRLAEIDKKLLEHDVVLREVVERLSPLLNPPTEDETKKPKICYHRGNR